MSNSIPRARRLAKGAAFFVLFASAPALLAATFDDHFTGASGGLPAGWTLIPTGDGVVIESGTQVSLGCGADCKVGIFSDTTFDLSTGLTMIFDVVSVGEKVQMGMIDSFPPTDGFLLNLSFGAENDTCLFSDGELELGTFNDGGVMVGCVPGYTGGPIQVTLTMTPTDFSVSTDSPAFAAGPLAYPGSFTPGVVGPPASAALVNDSETLGSVIDRIQVDAVLSGGATLPFIAPVGMNNALNGGSTGGPFYLGYQFQVATNDIVVSSLGVLADQPAGTSNSNPHAVGLWRVSDQVMLVSTTVPAGSGGLVGDFRYESVAPTLLTAGENYAIAAYLNNSDQNADWLNQVPTSADFNADPAAGTYVSGAGNFFQSTNVTIASAVFPAIQATLDINWPVVNFLFEVVPLDCLGDELSGDDDADGVCNDLDCEDADSDVSCQCTDIDDFRDFVDLQDENDFSPTRRKKRMKRVVRAASRNCGRNDLRDVWALLNRVNLASDGDAVPGPSDWLPDGALKTEINARALALRDGYGSLASPLVAPGTPGAMGAAEGRKRLVNGSLPNDPLGKRKKLRSSSSKKERE